MQGKSVNMCGRLMDGAVSTVHNIQKGVNNMQNKKVGIIQSRGLGDIIIALPIARHYRDQGYEVYWPVCEPFYEQMMRAAPWVAWLAVPVDERGEFFYENPVRQLRALGIEEADTLWLYQYLSSHPQRTNPSLFAQCKFDQYKYAAMNLPFSLKWELESCITRDPAREDTLYRQLVQKPRYMVYQNQASDLRYDIDLSAIEPDVQLIEITEASDSVFDWLKIIEGAEQCILIDSVFANLIDQLKIWTGPELYYLRKWNRRVDGNPVLLGPWEFVDVADPAGQQVGSLADTGLDRAPQQNPVAGPADSSQKPNGAGSGQTYTPFGQSKGTIPTSFLGATKQGKNEHVRKLNAAQQLQASLGLRK